MPPAATKKIATAIRSANRAIVNNYNAANRAVNRAPAWVKWTVGIVAVAVILYVIWKLHSGKKEGYGTYTEEKGFPTGGTEAIAYGQALSLKDTGGDNFFWSIDEIDKAKAECDRLNDCTGFARSGNLVKFMKDGYKIDPSQTSWTFHKKGAATTGEAATVTQGTGTIQKEFDANKDTGALNGIYFSKITDISANNIIMFKDVRFNKNTNDYQPHKESERVSFAWCLNTFKNANVNMMVYRNDGQCWFKNPSSKDDFMGATLLDKDGAYTYTTVIRKSLGFSTEQNVIDKAKEQPLQVLGTRGATHFKDINIAGGLTDIGSIDVNNNESVSACSKYTNEKGGHGFTLAYASDITSKCRAKQYFPDKLEGASIQTGQGDTYIFSDMLDGDGAVPDIPNESDLNAYGGNSDVSPSSTRKTTFDNWLKKSKYVLPELDKGENVDIYIQPLYDSTKYLTTGDGGAGTWMQLSSVPEKFTYNKTSKTLKSGSESIGAGYPTLSNDSNVVFRHGTERFDFNSVEFIPVAGEINVFLIKILHWQFKDKFASMQNIELDGYMAGWTDKLHNDDNYKFKLSLA